MHFREAVMKDIPSIQRIRHSVKENILSDPSLVTDRDCEIYITVRGKGWVCEEGNDLLGFAIADLADNNIWALFVHPEHEKKGIGKRLHNIMMNWYFSQTEQTAWLSTDLLSRAYRFYQMNGWQETGSTGTGEARFEMQFSRWLTLHS
jgi:GNAT superfamily N-acetyltransferase